MTAANTRGDRIPAALLQIPMMLMRWAARSCGPRRVMYGLAAVCRMDSPMPMVNNPIRKTP